MRDWQVCGLPQEYYMMQNASDEDICRILSAFGIDNAERIYMGGGSWRSRRASRRSEM